MTLKITCISDTHDRHNDLVLPVGDILLHAGDATMNGTKNQLEDFVTWFSKQPYTHKIWIAGNHDWGMEYDQTAYESWCGRRSRQVKKLSETRNHILELCTELGVTYLNNSGVTIEGLKIWGSPDQPYFYGWAFNRSHGALIDNWNYVPEDTNILITHCPAKGILDQLETGESVGDEALYDRVNQLPNLKLHLCGHIHNQHGTIQVGQVLHVNASILDDSYKIRNPPILINI